MDLIGLLTVQRHVLGHDSHDLRVHVRLQVQVKNFNKGTVPSLVYKLTKDEKKSWSKEHL